MTATSRSNINIIGREFFQVSLVTYLLLTLTEAIQEGFVSNFFNMNYLLIVVLITGVAMVLTEPAESEIRRAVTAASNTMAEAGRTVRRQVFRPTVDTVRTTGRTQVIDLRNEDTSAKGRMQNGKNNQDSY
jgi:hypothetical protein